MKKVSSVMTAIIAATVGMSATAQVSQAEEFTAVIDSIATFGNALGNSTARPVANKSIGVIITGKGKLYQQDKKTGAAKEIGDLKQLSIVLPDKVGDRSNAEDLCIRRAEALMAGENLRSRLEIAMDATRVGDQHYKVNKLIGCSDLKVSGVVKPPVTPTPIPRATATPVPRVTATPIPRATATPVPRATATPAPKATAKSFDDFFNDF